MEKSPRAMEGGSASSPVLRRRASHRALGSLSAPRSGASFLCEEQQQPRHFLDACFLCRRTLRASSDVFMYRGDTPFCSEVCRQEQIELDEAEEREVRRRRRRHHRHHASPVEQPASSAQVPAEAVVAG